MIKTKVLYNNLKIVGEKTTYTPIDEVINRFLEENNIDESKLIDIKLTSIGYFQPNDGEGEIEESALIIYKV